MGGGKTYLDFEILFLPATMMEGTIFLFFFSKNKIKRFKRNIDRSRYIPSQCNYH